MAIGGFERNILLLCCVLVVVCGSVLVCVTEGNVVMAELGV